MDYKALSAEERKAELAKAQAAYDEIKAQGLALNLSRGNPSKQQLDLSMDMMDVLDSKSDLSAENGTDCRTYGVLDGLPEAKKLMAVMGLGVKQGEEVKVTIEGPNEEADAATVENFFKENF